MSSIEQNQSLSRPTGNAMAYPSSQPEHAKQLLRQINLEIADVPAELANQPFTSANKKRSPHAIRSTQLKSLPILHSEIRARLFDLIHIVEGHFEQLPINSLINEFLETTHRLARQFVIFAENDSLKQQLAHRIERWQKTLSTISPVCPAIINVQVQLLAKAILETYEMLKAGRYRHPRACY